MIKNKHAQLWGMDLMIGVIIFALTISLFFIYTLNSTSESENTFEDLSYEGGLITETLLTPGSPTNWNNATVIQLGIVTNGRINNTKLEQLYNMTIEDYERTKRLFNTRYDYYFFLEENMTLNSNTVDGIGKTGFDRNNITGENLISINRITNYQNKPTSLTLYLWD